MITAIHRKKLLATLIMLLALAGLSLSVIGEAFSHGVAELQESPEIGQANQSHSHNGHSHDVGETGKVSPHHDAGNHTHETVDQLPSPLASQSIAALRQPAPFVGGSPRILRYRLERPPKALLSA
jgi:hypothetical protein